MWSNKVVPWCIVLKYVTRGQKSFIQGPFYSLEWTFGSNFLPCALCLLKPKFPFQHFVSFTLIVGPCWYWSLAVLVHWASSLKIKGNTSIIHFSIRQKIFHSVKEVNAITAFDCRRAPRVRWPNFEIGRWPHWCLNGRHPTSTMCTELGGEK